MRVKVSVEIEARNGRAFRRHLNDVLPNTRDTQLRLVEVEASPQRAEIFDEVVEHVNAEV